jgi:hypothetical protein
VIAAFYQRDNLEQLLTQLVQFSSPEAASNVSPQANQAASDTPPSSPAPGEPVDYKKLISAAQEKWGYRVPGGTAEADFQIANIHDYKNSPFIDVEAFAALLRNKDYRAAEDIFRERDKLLEHDYTSETNYSDFIRKIEGRSGVSLKNLDEWVASTGSEYAYASRAAYYAGAAWRARGSEFYKDTEDYKIARFKALSILAGKDAVAALDINGKSYSAYRVLFFLVNTPGLPMTESDLADMADKLFPWSYKMRDAYMYALYPQWGGSYREMDAYGNRVAKYNSINPALWVIQGSGMALRGKNAHKKGQYKECVGYYSQAMVFGVRSYWLKMRADCLEHLGAYQLALNDIDQALSIYSIDSYMKVKNKILENL